MHAQPSHCAVCIRIPTTILIFSWSQSPYARPSVWLFATPIFFPPRIYCSCMDNPISYSLLVTINFLFQEVEVDIQISSCLFATPKYFVQEVKVNVHPSHCLFATPIEPYVGRNQSHVCILYHFKNTVIRPTNCISKRDSFYWLSFSILRLSWMRLLLNS